MNYSFAYLSTHATYPIFSIGIFSFPLVKFINTNVLELEYIVLMKKHFHVILIKMNYISDDLLKTWITQFCDHTKHIKI